MSPVASLLISLIFFFHLVTYSVISRSLSDFWYCWKMRISPCDIINCISFLLSSRLLSICPFSPPFISSFLLVFSRLQWHAQIFAFTLSFLHSHLGNLMHSCSTCIVGRGQTHSADRTRAGKGTSALVCFLCLLRKKRGSGLLLVTELNKRVLSCCVNAQEEAVISVSAPQDPWRPSVFTWIPRRRGPTRGSPQVTGRHCRRMWLCGLLMRAYTSHLSVQLSVLSGRSQLRAAVQVCGLFPDASPSGFVFILAGVGSVIWVSIQSAGL